MREIENWLKNIKQKSVGNSNYSNFVKKCGNFKLKEKQTKQKRAGKSNYSSFVKKMREISNWKKNKQNKKVREIQITLILSKNTGNFKLKEKQKSAGNSNYSNFVKKCRKLQIDRKTNKTKKCGKFKLLFKLFLTFFVL